MSRQTDTRWTDRQAHTHRHGQTQTQAQTQLQTQTHDEAELEPASVHGGETRRIGAKASLELVIEVDDASAKEVVVQQEEGSYICVDQRSWLAL